MIHFREASKNVFTLMEPFMKTGSFKSIMVYNTDGTDLMYLEKDLHSFGSAKYFGLQNKECKFEYRFYHNRIKDVILSTVAGHDYMTIVMNTSKVELRI